MMNTRTFAASCAAAAFFMCASNSFAESCKTLVHCNHKNTHCMHDKTKKVLKVTAKDTQQESNQQKLQIAIQQRPWQVKHEYYTVSYNKNKPIAFIKPKDNTNRIIKYRCGPNTNTWQQLDPSSETPLCLNSKSIEFKCENNNK